MTLPRDSHRTRHALWAGLAGAVALAALIGVHATGRAEAAAPPASGWHERGGHAHGYWALEGALRWTGADADQRRAVRAIVEDAHTELEPLRDEHRERVHRIAAALLGSEVDRAELERLRQAELELAERVSQRLARALADAADQLSPEQRGELLEMLSLAH